MTYIGSMYPEKMKHITQGIASKKLKIFMTFIGSFQVWHPKLPSNPICSRCLSHPVLTFASRWWNTYSKLIPKSNKKFFFWPNTPSQHEKSTPSWSNLVDSNQKFFTKMIYSSRYTFLVFIISSHTHGSQGMTHMTL